MSDEAAGPARPNTAAPPGPAQRLARTDRGRQVLQDRSLPLSRAARNLLLIIDPTQPTSHWLAVVRGTSPADLQALLDAGLVAAPATPAAVPRIPLAQALERLDYSTLSTRLTAELRPQLGLIQGFRAALEIERASDVAALRLLALQLVEQVRLAQGTAVAQALAQALADGR